MGKPSAPVIGYHYRLAAHFILTPRKINGFLEFRGGTKTAWSGSVTESSTVQVDAPNLWGGEKDQGGIVTAMDFMFGDDDQLPNPYLVSVFGTQVCAWRGWTGVSLDGGRYGAMNPYAQKPSWKFWRTTAGWDDDACWYEAKAEVTVVAGDPPIEFNYDGGVSFPNEVEVDIGAETGTILLQYATGPNPDKFEVWFDGIKVIDTGYHGKGAGIFSGSTTYQMALDSYLAAHSLPTETIVEMPGSDANADAQWAGVVNRESASFEKTSPTSTLTVKVYSPLSGTIWNASLSRAGSGGLIAANPAHVLYETLTAQDMGREPVESINDASFRAAADKLYAEGFGICPSWDTGSESLDDFRERIEKLIAGSLNLSLEDGQWYLDLARGDYVLDDLPILTDDDLLDFKELPATLDNAINSVSVKWLDPQTKSRKTTAPVRALGLVRQFGTNHQVYDYPEIATEALALRVAQRELMATTTPTRAYDCAWKPGKVYKLRPNQYFRLQAPKRGIADMVCLVGEKQHGTLKSGAIKMKAVQDIYGMPTTSFSQGEPGVDTRPPQTPNAIALERTFEAPYVKVAASLARADLDALPADVGFAVAVAAQPDRELDFTMMVDDGAGYDEAGRGEWAATATVNEAAGKADTDFTLAAGKRLDQVAVGMGALWDDELVRVDAIDAGAGTITLARGCADTVPVAHAANARLWFYDVGMAYGATEYTDGEDINVKLLPNTGSQQLPIGSATPLALTFDQRQSRPYPPGKVRIDASAWPATVTGEFVVTWAHRDRLQQANQVVDTTAASIGPEPTARYALQLFDDDTDTLLVEKLDIGAATATCDLAADANVRLVLWTISDLGESWQKHEHVFAFTAAGGTDSIVAGSYAPPTWVIDGNGG